MTEYISREAAIALYEDDDFDMSNLKVPIPVIIQNLKDIPAADVVPVRHGKWIEQPLDFDLCGVAYYQCSECGKEQQTPSNYCQFCGALMDKDGDEDV